MPFQFHRRDYATAKECKNTCPDCPRRMAEDTAAAAQMGRALPEDAPEVLSRLRHRLHDRFVHTAADANTTEDEAITDGRL